MAGKLDKAKGTAKEKLGKATGDSSMEAEGKMDRAAGAVKDGASKAADSVREGIDRIKKKTSR